MGATQFEPPIGTRPARIYYGWVIVGVAALAMTATLPGRTHGLGLIAKPLTEDPLLGVSEGRFATLNFWAIILGSALCVPIGWLIDRFGVRAALTGVAALLGASVVWMSGAADVPVLFAAMLLVRGLGQGALSVVSMAMVGKWFTRRLGTAMGVYTVLMAIGFIASVVAVTKAVPAFGWRETWSAIGWFLVLGLAPIGWLIVRRTPESIGLPPDSATPEPAKRAALNLPLRAALCSPVFWAFTLSAALFNLTWSAITLFNESILAERGFQRETFDIVMAVLVFAGLPSNLVAGWLAGRWPLGRILVIGMTVFAISLAAFPFVSDDTGIILYAIALGVSGGVITVIFFATYGLTFGRAHLGAIQATVQIISVFASAIGPVLLVECKAMTGSYAPFFFVGAPAALVLGLLAWVAPMPSQSEGSHP